jgi:hypothetical protein
MERVLDLTLKLADEGLSADELGELERLIEAEPLARRRHLQMLEVEAALRSARHTRSSDQLLTAPSPSLDEERRVAAVLAAIGRPVRLLSWKRDARLRTSAILATTALAAAAAVLIIGRTRQHNAEGQPGAMARMSSRPPASRREQPPVPGRRGWSVAVLPMQAAPPADHVNLDLGDNSGLEVRGRTVLGIERAAVVPDDGIGSRVTLEEGTVSFHRAAGNPAQTAFSTPQAEVVLRAGRALLHVTAEQTRVDVVDGEARVALRTESRPTMVPAHHSATISGGRAAVTPLPSALFVTGREPSRVPSRFVDQVIDRRLETLGFVVDVIDEREVRAEHLQNRALIVISPTVSAAMHARAQDLSLYNVHVPILCSRPTLYQDLGMTAPGKSNAEFSNMKKYVTIVDHGHPIAAGLEGDVEVLEANMSIGWGVPGPGAARVAVMRDRPEHAAVFAYDRDAPMLPPATRAAARRVGFFLHPTAVRYSNDTAWQLFDAAVKWATEE